MQALILAGGSGTRFWPLSRKSRPKQLLALEGERSLLRETVERLRPLVEPRDGLGLHHARRWPSEVRRELPEVPPEQILLEPEGRNTAPAIGWSVRSMPEEARRDVVAVLPADHRMGDPAAFRDDPGARRPGGGAGGPGDDPRRRCRAGPRRATAIWSWSPRPGPDGVRRVRRFVEKPSAENAAARSSALGQLSLERRHLRLPRHDVARRSWSASSPSSPGGWRRSPPLPERLGELYGRLPADSIDYAVMEKLDDDLDPPPRLRLERSRLLGGAGRGAAPGRATATPAAGDRLAVDAQGNLLFSDAGTIAVAGGRGPGGGAHRRRRPGDAPRSARRRSRSSSPELAARGREDLL